MKKTMALLLAMTLLLTGLMTAVTVGAETTDTTSEEVAGETVALDLSGTKETVLAVGGTSKIVAKATDTSGNTATDTITYSSNDNEVASVSDDGTVTAHKKGVAIITAKSGAVEKSIVIMVGDKGKTLNFDSAPPATISTNTAKNTGYQFTTALDTTTYREGTGAWKFQKRTDVSEKKNSYALIASGGLHDKPAQTFAYWFYDDGSNGVKGRIHFRNGTEMYKGGMFDATYDTGLAEDSGKGRLSLRMIFNHTSGMYTNDQWDNGLQSLQSNSLNRSKGWHQVVLVNTFKTVTIYLDGQVWMSGNNTSPGMDFSLMEFYMHVPTTFSSVIFDDFVAVDTGTAIPQHTVTVNADGEHGAVKNGLATVSAYSYVNASGTTVNCQFNTIKVHDQDNLTLTLVPEDGYEAKVTVDNQEVTVQEDNTVTVENITADKTVNVSFEEIITEPSIFGRSADYIVTGEYGDNKDFAYVAYYKMAIPKDYQLKGCGMYFNESGAANEPLKLSAECGEETPNMFGICVFGEAVQEGKSYTFQGYAELTDGEGAESTVTSETVTK